MDSSPGSDEPKPRGGFAIWFAGALVAAAGLALISYQSKPPPPADDDPRERRAGLVATPAPMRGSLTAPMLDSTPGSLTPQAGVPLQRPQALPYAEPEPQGSPGELFSMAVANHRSYYARMAQKHAQSPVIIRFFEDWNRAPDLAALSRAYYKDKDAIKFAQGAVRSPRFSPLMKKYTLEADMRNYGMELIMGSPQEVLLAWTNYASKDPEGSRLQREFFNAMGVPPQFAQIMGNGNADSGQVATQVQALMPALLGGVDPKLFQKAQQQQQLEQKP